MAWTSILDDILEDVRARTKPKITPPAVADVERLQQIDQDRQAREWTQQQTMAPKVPTMDELREKYRANDFTRVPGPLGRDRNVVSEDVVTKKQAQAANIDELRARYQQNKNIAAAVIEPYRRTERFAEDVLNDRAFFRGEPVPPRDFRTLSQLPPSEAEKDLPSATRPHGGGLGTIIGEKVIAPTIATPLPYANEVADVVGDVVRPVLAAAYRLTPAAQPAVTPSGTTAEQETATQKGTGITEAFVPRYTGELLLEAVPGIGSGPDILRVLRSEGPEAARMVRRLWETPEGQGFLRKLVDEAGKVGEEGIELNPVTADDILGVSKPPAEQDLTNRGLYEAAIRNDGPPSAKAYTGLMTRANAGDGEAIAYLLDVDDVLQGRTTPTRGEYIEPDRGGMATSEIVGRYRQAQMNLDLTTGESRSVEATTEEIDQWLMQRDLLRSEIQRRAANGDTDATQLVRSGELGAAGTGDSTLRRDLALRGTATAAGAGAGATQGDSPEERLRNALLGAGAGLGVSDLAIRTGLTDAARLARGSDELGRAGSRASQLEREIATLKPHLENATDAQGSAYYERQIKIRQQELEDLRGGQATLFDTPLGEGTMTRMDAPSTGANQAGELELRSPTAPGGMFAEPGPEAVPPASAAPPSSVEAVTSAGEGQALPERRLFDRLRGESGMAGTPPEEIPKRTTLPMAQLHLRPEYFQARTTDEGLPYVQSVVNQIARDYDPELMDDLVIVPDNEQGGFAVLGGHHRYGALEQRGNTEAPVRAISQIDGVPFDITNPEHRRRAQIIADQTNLTQRSVDLKTRINVIKRFGSDDLGEIRATFPALNDQQILDAIYVREFPQHVIDKLNELPPSAPQIAIASEVGRARKVYGISEQDAEGLFNRLTRGKKLPTRFTVRETMERYGPALQASAQQGFDFGDQASFAASNPVLDMIDKHTRLVGELQTARKNELKFIRDAQKRGLSEADDVVRTANARVKELEADLARANDDVESFLKGQNAPPVADNVEPLPPAALPGQNALLDVESQVDEMAAAIDEPPAEAPRAETRTTPAGTQGEPMAPLEQQAQPLRMEPGEGPGYGLTPKDDGVRGLGEKQAFPDDSGSVQRGSLYDEPNAQPTGEFARTVEGAIGSALRPAEPPPMPRLSQAKLDQYLPARADFETQFTRAAENVGRYRLRLRAVLTRAANEKLTQGQFGNLTRRAIKQAQSDVRRAVRLREQAKALLNKSDVLVGEQDIIARARAAGATDEMVELLQNQFRFDVERQALDTPLVGELSYGQRINAAAARVKGTVRVLNDEAQDRLSLSNALAEQTNVVMRDVIAPLEKQLEKESASLRFVGKREFRDLADTHRLYYIVTHPEDFDGISPQLMAKLDRAEEIGKQQYEMLRALDTRIQPVIKGRYLPQLWEKTTGDFERVFRPRGRPGITKERTIRDWRKAILSTEWAKELKDLTPGELLEYSARTVDQAIADAMMRRSVLRRYGSPLAKDDLVPFRNPIYSGHHGPPEIVAEVDALYDPGPTWAQTEWTQKVKNQVFGPDFSVAGYNVLQALAGGNLKIVAGAINRGLNKLGMGVDLMEGSALTRRALYSQYGLAAGIKQSPFDAGAGTMLSFVPGAKNADKKISRLMQQWQSIQYGNILGGLNELAFEGNVIMARIARQDTNSIKTLRELADNSNAITGTSRGAARIGRAAIEAQTLSSARITRSQFALLGQMAKIAKIGSPNEQLAATTTLAGFAVTLGGVGYAISQMFGDGDYVFSPFSIEDGKLKYNSEWATVAIKGKRYNLIPQKSLATTLAKSVAAVSAGDWRKFEDAITQYGYTRINPGWSPIPTAAGYGFQPDRGFVSGDLPYGDRFVQSLPVPILAGTAIDEGGIDLRTGIEGSLGVGSYDQPTDEEEAEKDRRSRSSKARGVLEEYNDVDVDVWKELQDEGSAPKGHETIGEFRTATILELVAEIQEESPEASIIDAQAAAERIYGRQYGDLEAAHGRIVGRIRERMRQDPKIAEALVESGQTDAAPRQEELATP